LPPLGLHPKISTDAASPAKKFLRPERPASAGQPLLICGEARLPCPCGGFLGVDYRVKFVHKGEQAEAEAVRGSKILSVEAPRTHLRFRFGLCSLARLGALDEERGEIFAVGVEQE
jgi:hypothetical protein